MHTQRTYIVHELLYYNKLDINVVFLCVKREYLDFTQIYNLNYNHINVLYCQPCSPCPKG